MISNYLECCGCEACSNICPKSIIQMKENNEGFYYPHISDMDKCIHCNLCDKVCPVQNDIYSCHEIELSYAGYFENQNKTRLSSSGGFATALAEVVIKEGGVVYGVAYSGLGLEDIEYIRCTSISELERLRGSKYAQTRKNDVFNMVRTDLKNQISVLFIGVPCDVNALHLFLQERKYDNLYTCSLVCHGPTSQKVHRQYVDSLTKERSSYLNYFTLRYKRDSWKPYYIYGSFENGNDYLEKFAESAYGSCFKYLKRQYCYNCKFKKGNINSDFVIGDYHNGSTGNMIKYNRYGVNSIIVFTHKGQRLLDMLEGFYLESITLSNAEKNSAYLKPISKYFNREEFGNVVSKKDIYAATKLLSCRYIETMEKYRKQLTYVVIRIRDILRKVISKRSKIR